MCKLAASLFYGQGAYSVSLRRPMGPSLSLSARARWACDSQALRLSPGRLGLGLRRTLSGRGPAAAAASRLRRGPGK